MAHTHGRIGVEVTMNFSLGVRPCIPNRPFPSCCLSWYRSESWCSTIEMEMVVHQDSPWNWGTQQLGNGQLYIPPLLSLAPLQLHPPPPPPPANDWFKKESQHQILYMCLRVSKRETTSTEVKRKNDVSLSEDCVVHLHAFQRWKR